MVELKWQSIWQTCFAEDSSDGDGPSNVGSSDSGIDTSAGETSSSRDTSKTFTQDQVNTMLADDRRKHVTNTQKAIDELNAIKAKADLSQQERTELEERVGQLQATLLTKDELAAKEKKKLEDQLKTDTEEWKGKYTTLERRYNTETITRAITDAAVTNEAFSPKQVVAILKPLTQITEVLDEKGNGTSEFAPRVKLPDTNERGEAVILDLAPPDAVKRMTEVDEYFNLFKGKGTSGIGGTNNAAAAGEVDVSKMKPQEYMEKRRKGEIQFT